jgi:outer membrane protein OmpA-like peptidoglycan-associated protein
MYSNSPLVLYQFDEEVGSVVNNRFTTFAGVSVDVTRAFTVRASLPLYYQWGSDVPRYAADGFAVGDANVGFHWAAYRKSHVGLGVRLDVALPTARRDFYAGDRLPVFNPAFLLMAEGGRVRFASDLGVNLRVRDNVTTEDLSIGQELVWNAGVRVNAVRERLDVGAAVYSRFGFSHFFGAGETSGEFLVDLAIKTVPWLWVDVAAGRGFTKGYGTTDFRGWVQLRFQKIRPEEPEIPDEGFVEGQDPNATGGLKFDVRNLQGVHGGGEDGAPTKEQWAEGEFAKRERNQIKIRYAIQFERSTANLTPESYPTLDYIADMLNHDARIGHVVIEGHASTEGAYDFNYKLSLDRAASIWRRLVEQGVHPSRLSIRGMGEVVPLSETGGEDELKAERRVVFEIVRQYDDVEAEAEAGHLNVEQKYPWNGEPYEAVRPTIPAEGEELDLGPPPPGVRPDRTEGDLAPVDFGKTAPDDDIDVEQGEPAPAAPQEEHP